MGDYVLWWGRKDAFPGADGSTITQATGTNQNAETIILYGTDGTTELIEDKNGYCKVSITTEGILSENTSQTYSVKHPLTVIYNSFSVWDWYTNTENHNDDLWGDGEHKSDYDPCPLGWRVSQDGIWNDFEENTKYYSQGTPTSAGNSTISNGVLYNDFVWFPAGGRIFTTGTRSNVGNNVFLWSSTVSGTSAKNIYCSMGGVLHISTYGRTNALSIRCVQE